MNEVSRIILPDSNPSFAGRRYKTIIAFEAALTAKLNEHVTPQRTYQDIRKELAFDRILARLMRVSPETWLLKGGVALEYRLQHARATTDIDISARGSLDTITDSMNEAAALEMNDYFAIRIGEITKPVDEVQTFRFSVDVLYKGGRTFEPIKIDVGFADPWLGEAQKLTGRALLDFAGIAPVSVRVIPIVQHLAEKIHAYTTQYGAHGSTRVKDLVDMVLLINAAPLDDEAQADILRKIFESRNTHVVPAKLSSPPASWRAPYAKLADGLPVPHASDEAYAYVAEKLKNVLAIAAGCRNNDATEPSSS